MFFRSPLALLASFSLAATPLLGACRTEAQADSQSGKPGAGSDPAPLAVETIVAAEQAMPEYLLVTGTLLANRESRVAAGVTGKVLGTRIERGTMVKKGQVLVDLDTRTVSANTAEALAAAKTARTQREQAKTDCERSKVLYAKGALSQAEYDRSQSQCLATQSQAEGAEARARSLGYALGDAEIRAPFSGFVAERSINAGEYVVAATVVATIVETDPLRLELSVPESAALSMHQDLPVEFRLAANESERFEGTVRYIGPSVRRSSRDLLVEAVVDNGEHKLIPGMFATARVHVGDPKRVTVPQAAVREEGSLHHVFIVQGGKAEDHIVQLGEKKDDLIAILDGVKVGDQVILAPGQLVDGLPITAKARAR